MYTALRATSLTLAGILQQHIAADPILGPFFDAAGGGTMEVRLSTPDEMQEHNVEGLSVWLYRVVRDEERLNMPPQRVTPTTVRQPPLPLRLHYLITAITNPASAVGPATEQVILGKVLQVLNAHLLLRGTDLRDDFTGTDVELRVRLETLSLEQIYQIWEALEGSYQLSLSYEVSVVEIESELAPESVSPVMTTAPEYGVVVSES